MISQIITFKVMMKMSVVNLNIINEMNKEMRVKTIKTFHVVMRGKVMIKVKIWEIIIKIN